MKKNIVFLEFFVTRFKAFLAAIGFYSNLVRGGGVILHPPLPTPTAFPLITQKRYEL